MKKVLILTAGFGDGHNTAARNVADALEMISDEVKVEVLDVFQTGLGLLNDVLKKAYLGLTRFAPASGAGFIRCWTVPANWKATCWHSAISKARWNEILTNPSPIASSPLIPVYAHVIREIYRDHSERPFRFITVVTDSISVNSSWFRAPSDWFCVPNEATAEVLRKGGVAPDKIKAFGFPVNPIFADETRGESSSRPDAGAPVKVLYIINTGKKKSGKAIDRLLENPAVHLTITVGRDAELKEKLARRTEKFADRVRVLGWTNQMPRLMMTHHLVITKAGGATVQEAIAGRCPMILNQVIPGQEEGNAELVRAIGRRRGRGEEPRSGGMGRRRPSPATPGSGGNGAKI